MFKRFLIVFVWGPMFILFLSIDILLVCTSIIWGPIYYIITGNDPINEEVVDFFPDKAFEIKERIFD